MISTAVQVAKSRTPGKASLNLSATLSAPTAGNLLIAFLSVDKFVTNPVAPSGFTLGPSWTGTAGTGLAWAYKLSAAGTESNITWTWSNSAGAAMVVVEFPVVSAAYVTATVNGTESNVNSLTINSAATAAAGLRFGVVAVDSAGDDISPATWPNPAGPDWSGLTSVTVQLGNGVSGGSSLAVAAAPATSGAAQTVTSSYTGTADQEALIVGTFTGTERGAVVAPAQGAAAGTWATTGSASGATPGVTATCSGAEVGAVTQSGAVLAFDLSASAAARAVLSTNAALTSPTYGSSATGKVVKSTVSGLTAGVLYYWGVEINGVLASSPRGSFRTAPAGAASFKVVLGSCAGQSTSPYITNAISNAPTFEAMRNVGAQLFLHMGDRHYGDLGNVAQATYVAKNAAVRATARQAALHHSLVTVYHPDDHDGPGNNWSSTTAGAATALAAWDQAIPHHPLAVTGTWAHTFTWGRARFVILDTRSKRASGTILGADQLAWATNLVRTATERLLVIDTGVAYIGDGVTGSDATDSWGAYSSDRQQLAQAITAARAAGRDVVIVAGDAHMVAVDDGTNSQYDPAAAGTRGPVVFQAAPFDATGSTKGGPYSAGTFTQSRYQFGVLDVVDNGVTLTATVTGYTTSTTDPYPATAMVSRTALAAPRGSAAGTWATAAAATGRRQPRGATAGTWATASTATGKTARRGAAAGSWGTTGAAAGQTPGVVVPPGKGAAAGTWGTASTATGRRTPKGASAGTWATKGAASGPNAYVANPNDPITAIATDETAPNLAIELQPDYDVGTFIWGVSEWDSLDLLAWGNGADGWQNVVCDVIGVRSQRGQSRAGGLVAIADEGTCTITLADTERRFDPTANAEAVHAGTPIRVRAWGEGWSEVLFTGRIGQGADGLQVVYHRDEAPTVTILAVDRVMPLSSWKSTGRDEPGTGGGDTMLGRVNRMLAEMQWPASTIGPDIDTAYAATLASNTLASAWDVIADATEAELGRLWVDRFDRLILRSRGSQLSGPVRGTLSDVHDEIAAGAVHCCYTDPQVVYGTELLANRAIAGRRIPDPGDDTTPPPTALAQVDDTYSQGRYGVSVLESKTLELETDSQLLPWAQTVVLDHTEPELRVNAVTPTPFNAPGSWPQVVATDIGDRWAFRLRPQIGPVVARTLGILGVSHDITPDDWVVTWVTETAPTPGDDNPSGWFTWGLSQWDSDDLLAPIGGAVSAS